ncbi:MAG TPA: CPBP family intramembrane metalloprotease [Erysipelotrichaceae bacterium]|nr:CPBP family intramembrane metalloprotease [Erysipelotrichaceae bacterium]
MNTFTKHKYTWIFYIFSALLLIYYVDHSLQPGYWIKSMIKLILFALSPLFFLNKEGFNIQSLFKFKQVKWHFYLFCIGIILLILIGYFIVNAFTSLTNIPDLLNQQVKVNLNNFLWVSLYIILINSALEEFFFRFLLIKIFSYKNVFIPHLISALLFALYHVAIISQWFEAWLFILIVIGLTVVGLFFSFLNNKKNGITHSYLVHLSANIGINLVGLILMLQ